MIKTVNGIFLQFAVIVVMASAAVKTGEFTFDNIFEDVFYPKIFNPTWVRGEEAFTFVDSEGNFVKYDIEKDKTEILVYAENLGNASVYFLSPNGSHVLLGFNLTELWRHSFYADYEIFDTKHNTATELGKNYLYANWGNTGKYLSYVYNNNLYVRALSDDYEWNITDTGSEVVFNGAPNWLYEEDVLSSRVSHYWSPDDKHLCYATIDDSEVGRQHWPWYGSRYQTYEDLVSVTYPKAGLVDGKLSNNSKVTLHVAKINATDGPFELEIPSDLDGGYYLQVAWRNNESVLVTWVNRRQDTLVKTLYDVTNHSSKPIEIYKHVEKNGWIDNKQQWPIFTKDHYFSIEPHTILVNGKNETWRHPVKVGLNTDAHRPDNVEFLLGTREEVTELVGYNEVNDTLYYITTRGISRERHLSKLHRNKTTCLTCDDRKCKYASASFSDSGKYYMLNCLGPQSPTSTLRNETSRNLKVFEKNDKFSKAIFTKITPTKEFIEVKKEDYVINIELYTPGNKRKGEKFPLLVYTYAGPGTQETSERMDVGSTVKNWLLHLSSQHRILVASIDGRGTAGSGEDHKFKMYKNLGVVEVQDQVIGAEYLRGNSEWVDTRKPIAIFGWSYGGQTAALALADGSNVYKCGISVAPVTYQALYDTAYVERYLGLSTENGTAYENTDVSRKADNFAGKQFLIAHGLADDNVHYSHFAHLIKELEKKEIVFSQLTYPDENHSISGKSRHLFKTMTKFLKDCYSRSAHLARSSGFYTILGVTTVWLFACFALS